MDNYPTDLSRESSLQRGTLVAKYLMQNGNFSAEQAAAIAGVFVDENGCYPGDLNDGVKQQEIEWYGSGYGAGIGSWTGVNEKNQVLPCCFLWWCPCRFENRCAGCSQK